MIKIFIVVLSLCVLVILGFISYDVYMIYQDFKEISDEDSD